MKGLEDVVQNWGEYFKQKEWQERNRSMTCLGRLGWDFSLVEIQGMMGEFVGVLRVGLFVV